MLYINDNIKIPLSECKFSFARSSGPGGQNVNKVNSKAIMRWAVTTSSHMPWAVRARFLAKYATRITIEGELVLSSQKYRDQNRNIDDCLEKLKTMIEAVAIAPIQRRPTKPTLGSKIRHRQSKQEHSKKKQQRRVPTSED